MPSLGQDALRVQECTYEYQRWDPVKGFIPPPLPSDPYEWSTADRSNERKRENVKLPSVAWQWEGDWYVDPSLNEKPLDKGWTYAFDFCWEFRAEMSPMCYVRRRRWIRYRRYLPAMDSREEESMYLCKKCDCTSSIIENNAPCSSHVCPHCADELDESSGLGVVGQASIAAGAAAAAGGAAAAGVVAGVPAALGAAGFGVAGVLAKSPAALFQAARYGGAIPKGSPFALAQKVAMGGVALGPIGIAVGLGAAGVVAAGVGIGFAVKNSKNRKRAEEAKARDYNAGSVIGSQYKMLPFVCQECKRKYSVADDAKSYPPRFCPHCAHEQTGAVPEAR